VNTIDMLISAHPNTQPKRQIDRFSRFCTAYCRKSLYFPFPKNCPFRGGSGPPSNTWFPGPTLVLNSNGISIGSAVLQGSLAWQTDWQTDRPRYSVGNSMPHLARHVVLLCSLITNEGRKTSTAVKIFIHQTAIYRIDMQSSEKKPYHENVQRLYNMWSIWKYNVKSIYY